jgi:hypothetical protein
MLGIGGIRRSYLAVNKIYRWISIIFRVKLKAAILPYQPGHLAVRVIKVTESQRPCWAGVDAGWGSLAVYARLQSLGQTGIDPLHAEVAFLRGTKRVGIEYFTGFFKVGLDSTREKSLVLVFREESAVLVRAGDNAVAAADALVLVNIDNPVITPLGSPGRAYLNAGSVMALVASHRVGRHRGMLTARRRYRRSTGRISLNLLPFPIS